MPQIPNIININRLIIFGVFLLSLGSNLTAQEEFLAKDIFLVNKKNTYKLKNLNIISGSETVFVNNEKVSAKLYSFDYPNCSFSFSDSLWLVSSDTISVLYKTIKLSLKRKYRKKKLVRLYDKKLQDTVQIGKTDFYSFSADDIFGSKIDKSGSVIRGFTVGTNKSFSVSSGLRLQLSGEITNNIRITAALTDENVPIQPEGNTERLDELDKVFIEIKHPNVTAVFGDYQLEENNGEFGVLSRKLQGFKTEANYKNNKVEFAIASSRGKFTTNKFNGIEGVQGPYRLKGNNDEVNIMVIAGSEKVYIDGEEVKRGENNDYVIEYSNSQITFTPNRLITSVSRITVDFEYTDRKYNRTFLGASAQTSFIKDKIKIGFSFFQEGDQKGSPIDIVISDEEKKRLELSGDDRNKASFTGIREIKPDSQGVYGGYYIEQDTIISSKEYKVYKYSPGNPKARYNITFSAVGEFKGDYKMISIGHYEFIGIGKGNYLPIKFLPMPEKKQIGNVIIEVEPYEKLKVKLELSGSNYDKNTFSVLDKEDNFGYARNAFVEISNKNIKIGKTNLGNISLSFRDRFIDANYNPIGRFNSVEYNRDYNIQKSFTGNEHLQEVRFKFLPSNKIMLTGLYGSLKKNNVTAKRYATKANIKGENYNATYNIDYADTKNSLLVSKHFKQLVKADYNYSFIMPGLEYLSENKKDKFLNSDTLSVGSFKFYEVSPFLQLKKILGLNLKMKYSFRSDYLPIKGEMKKESEAFSNSYQLDFRNSNKIRTSFVFTFRNKKYNKDFVNNDKLNTKSILIRNNTTFNFLNRFGSGSFYYEAINKRVAKLERVFMRVPRGNGNYIYLGDLNKNGIAEEYEFEQTIYDGDYIAVSIPTNELFPVIDLKLNFRLRLEFSQIVGKGLLKKILQPISSETNFRIEENSKTSDTKEIYLLNFSKFLNENTTVRGANIFQQDIHLFQFNSSFSLRIRFMQNKSLNQYSYGLEKEYLRERSIRSNFKLTEGIRNRTEIKNKRDITIAPKGTNRSRNIRANSFSTDFSYYPWANIEFGFMIKVEQIEDTFPIEKSVIKVNEQTVRSNISFAGKGRFRIELERKEYLSSTTENFIPFEITEGNSIGKNYYWRFNFDYRLASNLQTTIGYQGRLHEKGSVINLMRAELRAYF